MARINLVAGSILIFSSYLGWSTALCAQTASLPPDLPDTEAVRAYENYWQAFDDYESDLIKNGRKKFSASWEDLKKSYQKQKFVIDQKQIEKLQNAAKNYRKHLEEHPNANNRPFVLLNLAQINFLIGNKLAQSDAESGSYAKDEAINYLKEIEDNHKGFVYREQAQYLRAIILESIDRPDEALAVWEAITASGRDVGPVFYAYVAIGDHYFSRDLSSKAVPAYQRAMKVLEKLDLEDPDYERMRVNYRLAWAAYRSTDLNVAVGASLALLEPNPQMKDEDQREKIQQDAINLIGDALYEVNSRTRSQEILKRRDLSVFAPKIGLRTLTRYFSNNIFNEAILLGEELIEEFPLSKEAPEFIQITADSLERSGQQSRRIAVLEKLAMMLPAGALWRSRHRDDPATIRDMEQKAREAAAIVASWHYERGLAAGSMTAFAAAASHYEMLINNSPNSDQASQYRLRLAHCHFFSGQNEEAANLYEALKNEYKVDAETLQIASYQLVLTNERLWRQKFGKLAEKGSDPTADSQTQAALRKLEKSVDEFSARFPGQSRAVDLLLVAANANRDMNDFEHATNYWQRVLVSQPSPPQRAVAVRGLVFSTLKTQSPGQVVELTRRFLKLEDWQTLGLNIGTELKGILSAATLDEGKRLNDSGKILEAGQLLSSIASDFNDIPNRDRIWRDGGYLLAIAGDWAGAQNTAEAYLETDLKKNRPDMIYLAGRAHEYQMRLHDAAKRYYELASKFPSHPRAASSLSRAENLALAEDDYSLAAVAALEAAKREKDSRSSQLAFQRAVTYREKSGDVRKAIEIAQARLTASKTPAERFKADIVLNRLLYTAGREQEALDNLTVLSRRVERDKTTINSEDYSEIAGEIYFLLGEEARRQFDDFKLSDRSGSINANIQQKSRFFEELVASYDKAAATGSPKWATQARYRLATVAEEFAEEIASIPNRANEAMTFKTQSRYKATIDRLKNLAKRYYSSNALAARRDVAKYKDNEWVKKSVMRINNENSDISEVKHKDQLPVALPDTMTLQWSL